MTETNAEYHSESEQMWVSTNERAMITKMMKYAGKGMEIIKNPEENEGYLYCKVPKTWLKITPPRKLNISDEERMRRAERLKSNE